MRRVTLGSILLLTCLMYGTTPAADRAAKCAAARANDVGSCNQRDEAPVGDCASCTTCVQEPGAVCDDEMHACLADAECFALIDCASGCTDQACLDECYRDIRGGQARYDAAVQCMATNCAASCT